MAQIIHQSFATEKAASDYLVLAMQDDFKLLPECRLRHGISGNRLRVDFLCRPKDHTGFPFDLFAVEVKKGFRKDGHDKVYCKAIKQCADYRNCYIDDFRAENLAGVAVPYVFLFPGGFASFPESCAMCGNATGGVMYSVNRLAGMMDVGLIYTQAHWQTGHPFLHFEMSASRVWSQESGGRQDNFKTRRVVGSGVKRLDSGAAT